jgi:hypothetical protein
MESPGLAWCLASNGNPVCSLAPRGCISDVGNEDKHKPAAAPHNTKSACLCLYSAQHLQ